MTQATITAVIEALRDTALSFNHDAAHGTVTVYGFAGTNEEFAPIEMIVREGANGLAVVTHLAAGYCATAEDLNTQNVAEWLLDNLA